MVLEPQVSNLSVLEYFSGQLSPSTVSQVINVALDYARILLQLRKGRFAAPEGGDLSDPSTLAALTEQCKFM